MVSPGGKQIVLAQFDKCPSCKSENSLMRNLLKKEVKEGKIGEDEVQAGWFMQTAVIMNPEKPPLVGSIIPTGTGVIDICIDCGNAYALLITKAEQVYTPAPMPGMLPFSSQQ